MRRHRRAVSCYQPTRHAIAVVWDWALRLDLKVDVVSFFPCEEEVGRRAVPIIQPAARRRGCAARRECAASRQRRRDSVPIVTTIGAEISAENGY